MLHRTVLTLAIALAAACWGGGQPAPAPAPAPPRAAGAGTPWSPADPPPRQAASSPAVPTLALYSRLGGLSAIRSVVDSMLARVGADARINAFFRGVNMDTLRLNLVEQICAATGGPCTYRGRPMPEAHRGLNLTDAHFDALVEDLAASLDVHRVPARERTELLTALGALRGEIVGK